MPVVIESRRKKLASVQKLWPGALVVDVTSKGPEPWVRFSPFLPHGGIPVPNSPGVFAQSVEGLWQGLKVTKQLVRRLERLGHKVVLETPEPTT
jgi:hypothetical protein